MVFWELGKAVEISVLSLSVKGSENTNKKLKSEADPRYK